MLYHPEIQRLDELATKLYAEGHKREATEYQIRAGQLQQKLVRPIGKRYLTCQWCWAYGHIGLLHMLVKWFRKTEPETKLIIETQGRINNQYFFKALEPFLTVVDKLPIELEREAQDNAVYFGCPDGTKSIHNFYKQVSRQCSEIILTPPQVDSVLDFMEVHRPFVALHARQFDHDPSRNVTLDMIIKALDDVPSGFDVVSIGIDDFPALEAIYKNVRMFSNPWYASFALSATCDRFIGSNSGAWTVANAYGKPVQLMNDFEHKAWIYPEEIEE